MSRDRGTRIPAFVLAWLVVGSYARAQMPTVEGKGGRAGAIDEGILRNQGMERFQAPAIPAPPPARAFDVNVRRRRTITLEPPVVSPPADADDLPGPREGRPAEVPEDPNNVRNAVLKRENFDRWVFSEGVFEVGRRDHLDALIRQQVESLSRSLALTPEQSAKLRLAGQGDVKRFLDRVEIRRREFEVARMDYNLGHQFLMSLDPLRREFEVGPFGEGSLFAKTLRKIENDADAARPMGNR